MHSLFLQGWNFQRERKIPEALECYEMAKKAGDKCALFHWNCMDRYGQDMPLNINNFINWDKFTLLNDEFECLYNCYKDIDEAEIQLNLGIVYDIHKQPDQALVCLSKTQDYLPVLGCLGWHFHKLKDYETALKWYNLGASQGCPRAQNRLGFSYENGTGVTQDYTEAAHWYQLAANQGHNPSQLALGYLYTNERWISHSYTEARKYFLLAADHGSGAALANLAILYQNGLEVDRNYYRAVEYYKQAIAKGFKPAEKCLEEILSFENKISATLLEFIPIGKAYGISYLFFGNFLSFLTKKYQITEWNDLIFKSWITIVLLNYFRIQNPNFSEEQVAEWFRDLYADE